jgi:hypothetical protein
MLLRRCLMLASVSACAYPRTSYATSYVTKSSYRERFEKLNESDNQIVLENYKKELTRAFGHSHIVSSLSNETINDLHYILVLYSKPLSPERRIMLRKRILPYLESSDKDTQKFFEYILKYYDVL